MIDLRKSKFHEWQKRLGLSNHHNGAAPKTHWLTPDEVDAVIAFAKKHVSNNVFFLKDGYRRIAYTMIDRNIVAASPSSVYRILKKAGLLNRWNTKVSPAKGKGFKQPGAPHKHWHIDIKYVNFHGSFFFLISIIDGYSRFIVHHELCASMTHDDVQLTIRKAKELFPHAKPRIISDNGSQFIAKEFKAFIAELELTLVRTSVNYPQSNGKIERFHRTIAEECLKRKAAVSIADLRDILSHYINYYNTERLHAAIYYLTPVDRLNGLTDHILAVREAKLAAAERSRAVYWESHNLYDVPPYFFVPKSVFC